MPHIPISSKFMQLLLSVCFDRIKLFLFFLFVSGMLLVIHIQNCNINNGEMTNIRGALMEKNNEIEKRMLSRPAKRILIAPGKDCTPTKLH